MPRSLLPLLLSVVLCACRSVGGPEPLRIGVLTDCQYADKEDGGVRKYRASPRKLAEALERFEELDPEWLVHLGDFIDEGWESYEPLLDLCRASELRSHHVLGNHDFAVEDRFKEQVPARLGMPARYFTWRTKGWRFLALDGNDLSLHGHPEGSVRQRQSLAYYERVEPRPPVYCGAVGATQMEWLEAELSAADALGEASILLCHFPLLGADGHRLWNAEEVLAVLDRHPSVVACLSGHNHAGEHAVREGVHHLSFRGMVDTDENAFALVELDAGRLRVQGFGREVDRDLVLRCGGVCPGQGSAARTAQQPAGTAGP